MSDQPNGYSVEQCAKSTSTNIDLTLIQRHNRTVLEPCELGELILILVHTLLPFQMSSEKVMCVQREQKVTSQWFNQPVVPTLTFTQCEIWVPL